MALPQARIKSSGTSRLHPALVASSTFLWKKFCNDPAPQTRGKSWDPSPPSESVSRPWAPSPSDSNIFFRYMYRPWYKPEPTTAFGTLREKLLVKLGMHVEMPGPQ